MWQMFGLIFIISVGFSDQYKKYLPGAEHPGKNLYCADKVEGWKKVGEVWTDFQKCEKKTCKTYSGDSVIEIEGCQIPMLPVYRIGDPGRGEICRQVKPDFSKTFPDCCKRYACVKISKTNE